MVGAGEVIQDGETRFTPFSGTSLKVDENPADNCDRDALIFFKAKMASAEFSSTFKLVPENCASYMLQPAEKPHFRVQDTSATRPMWPKRPEYVHKFFSCQHPPTGILQLIAMSLYNILRNMYVCMLHHTNRYRVWCVHAAYRKGLLDSACNAAGPVWCMHVGA